MSVIIIVDDELVCVNTSRAGHTYMNHRDSRRSERISSINFQVELDFVLKVKD